MVSPGSNFIFWLIENTNFWVWPFLLLNCFWLIEYVYKELLDEFSKLSWNEILFLGYIFLLLKNLNRTDIEYPLICIALHTILYIHLRISHFTLIGMRGYSISVYITLIVNIIIYMWLYAYWECPRNLCVVPGYTISTPHNIIHLTHTNNTDTIYRYEVRVIVRVIIVCIDYLSLILKNLDATMFDEQAKVEN